MTIKKRIANYFAKEILWISSQDAQRRINGLARQFKEDTEVYANELMSAKYGINALSNAYNVEKRNREHLVQELQKVRADIHNLFREREANNSKGTLGRLLELEKKVALAGKNIQTIAQCALDQDDHQTAVVIQLSAAVEKDLQKLHEKLTELANSVFGLQQPEAK